MSTATTSPTEQHTTYGSRRTRGIPMSQNTDGRRRATQSGRLPPPLRVTQHSTKYRHTTRGCTAAQQFCPGDSTQDGTRGSQRLHQRQEDALANASLPRIAATAKCTIRLVHRSDCLPAQRPQRPDRRFFGSHPPIPGDCDASNWNPNYNLESSRDWAQNHASIVLYPIRDIVSILTHPTT